ncbi:hypothetical protein K1719_001229 [Acacia pycnantha]|nr:hypothetical protein K1719_001229 [Acacia pycnantha]
MPRDIRADTGAHILDSTVELPKSVSMEYYISASPSSSPCPLGTLQDLKITCSPILFRDEALGIRFGAALIGGS